MLNEDYVVFAYVVRTENSRCDKEGKEGKEMRERKPEKKRTKKKKYYAENKEQILKYKRMYFQEHPEKNRDNINENRRAKPPKYFDKYQDRQDEMNEISRKIREHYKERYIV